MDRRVTPPKRVTSPTWSPPPPRKQALRLRVVDTMWFSSVDTCLRGFRGRKGGGGSGSFGSAMCRRFLHRWISWLADPPLFYLLSLAHPLLGSPFLAFFFFWRFGSDLRISLGQMGIFVWDIQNESATPSDCQVIEGSLNSSGISQCLFPCHASRPYTKIRLSVPNIACSAGEGRMGCLCTDCIRIQQLTKCGH